MQGYSPHFLENTCVQVHGCAAMPDWIGDYEMQYKYLPFGRLVISPRFLLQAVLSMGCYSVTHTHTPSPLRFLKACMDYTHTHELNTMTSALILLFFFFLKQMCHQRPVETLPNPVTSFM